MCSAWRTRIVQRRFSTDIHIFLKSPAIPMAIRIKQLPISGDRCCWSYGCSGFIGKPSNVCRASHHSCIMRPGLIVYVKGSDFTKCSSPGLGEACFVNRDPLHLLPPPPDLHALLQHGQGREESLQCSHLHSCCVGLYPKPLGFASFTISI